jgi:hypothetical protein
MCTVNHLYLHPYRYLTPTHLPEVRGGLELVQALSGVTKIQSVGEVEVGGGQHGLQHRSVPRRRKNCQVIIEYFANKK